MYLLCFVLFVIFVFSVFSIFICSHKYNDTETYIEPFSNDIENESKLGKHIAWIQIPRVKQRTDVRLCKTDSGADIIVKGPFLKEELYNVKKYLKLQEEKDKYNIPHVNCVLKYLYPDEKFQDFENTGDTPTGMRQFVDKTKKYGFMICESIIPESKYHFTKTSDTDVWKNVYVVDRIKTVLQLTDDIILNFSEQQYIDFFNSLAFRSKHKLNDMCLQNFITDGVRVYSIDEETSSSNFSLSELMHSKKLKEIYYEKYTNKINQELKKFLEFEFSKIK